MYHNKLKNREKKIQVERIITVVFVLLFLCIVYSISQIQGVQNQQTYKELKDAISRSCVHEYANTGAYPESLEDIQETYGIHIDNDKYMVHYEIFASNIMPKITVIERKER